MKNVAESLRVRKLVRARLGRCYLNAFWTVLNVPGYGQADYVEGILILDNGCYLEHGWVERAGEIIDPTLPAEGGAYFPGLRFAGRPGLAAALQLRKPSGTADLPFFYRFGWGGADIPDFCRAREQASAYQRERFALRDQAG